MRQIKLAYPCEVKCPLRNLILCFVIFLFLTSVSAVHAGAEISADPFKGERITYSIKKLGMTAGTATVSFDGRVQFEGQEYYLIVFRATGLNFLDEERIYADTETLLPVQIVRNLNIFGSKEKITEYYTRQPAQVRIVKKAQGRTTEQVIAKEAAIDNIYCFIYRYRQAASFQLGNLLRLNLPTKEVQLSLTRTQKISAAGKVWDTYFMASQPEKYKVWFAGEAPHVPVRIDGAVGFGDAQMVMREYQKP